MSETENTTARQAPTSVWAAARVFLCIVFDLFGAPEAIARRHTLTAKAHAQLSLWLRAGEALMRRLLLIEAALIAGESSKVPPPSRRHAGKMPAVRPRKTIEHDPDQPDAWRVSFRIFSSPVHGGGVGEADGGGDGRRVRRPHRLAALATSPAGGGRKSIGFRSAWPLAERAEALLRAFNDPAPYARGLAARLRKQAALAQRIAAEAWGQFREFIGHTLHDALTTPITNAARVFAGPAPNTS